MSKIDDLTYCHQCHLIPKTSAKPTEAQKEVVETTP